MRMPRNAHDDRHRSALIGSHVSGCIPYPVGVYIAHADDIKASAQSASAASRARCAVSPAWSRTDRYCIDIVTQIAAVRAALRRVEEEILRDHVAHCVEHAIASGNKADQRRKIEELMDVVGRADR